MTEWPTSSNSSGISLPCSRVLRVYSPFNILHMGRPMFPSNPILTLFMLGPATSAFWAALSWRRRWCTHRWRRWNPASKWRSRSRSLSYSHLNATSICEPVVFVQRVEWAWFTPPVKARQCDDISFDVVKRARVVAWWDGRQGRGLEPWVSPRRMDEGTGATTKPCLSHWLLGFGASLTLLTCGGGEKFSTDRSPNAKWEKSLELVD